MGVVAPVCELLQRLRLFERRQILPLQVFDQGQLQHLGIARHSLDDRQLPESRLDRGVIAAFSRNDLEPRPALPDDERLDDAFLRDGRDQLRDPP